MGTILVVADGRKGKEILASTPNSVQDIFSQVSSDCPVSVSTACTAEDAMRALGTRAYDLFICDNQFAPPNQLTRFSPEDGESRLQVRNSGGDKDVVRKSVMEFFEKEAFTVEQGDGSLSGVDAL